MLIETFPSGPFSTNAYVLACKQTKKAAVIDPSPDSYDPIKKYLEQSNLNCSTVLLTHSHWDHIADVKKFQDNYHLPVYVHPLDAPNLEKPGADGLPFWIPIEGVKPDGWLEEEIILCVGNIKLKIIHTPGHSPGSVCLHEAQHKILFSGDTLFKGSIGNLSFPTSVPKKMWESLKKLESLPPETQVYPGHGPPTTIQEELSWLPRAKEIFN